MCAFQTSYQVGNIIGIPTHNFSDAEPFNGASAAAACRFANRERSDNIAQVFLPQLADVKKSMISLKIEADLDICNTWIKVIFLMLNFTNSNFI